MTEPTRRTTVALALTVATATIAAYSPQLLTDTDEFAESPLVLRLGWVALMLGLPPVSALVAARRLHPPRRAMWLAALLPPLGVALAWFDVWLEVRSGYLLAGSGEEAMSYGLSVPFGAVGGIIIGGLVAAAVGLGTRSDGRDTTRREVVAS